MAPGRVKELVPKGDLNIIWNQKDMNLFKEDMTEVLESQLEIRKSCMPKTTLRLCEQALKQLVYYHDLCANMNAREFDNRCEHYDFKNDIAKKFEKVEEEQKKREELEKIVEDLESQLLEAKKVNVSKKELLQTRDGQLEEANAAALVKKEEYIVLIKEAAMQKDKQAKEVKEAIEGVKDENKKMQNAIGQAENSTKGLKNALEACGSVLKEAPEEEAGEKVE